MQSQPSTPPQHTPIDLNILPPQYRPRATSRAIMLVWIIAACLAALIIPAFFLGRSNQGRIAELNREIQRAQSTLQALRTPDPIVVELSDELSRTQRAIDALQVLSPTLAANRRDWPQVFEAILSYDANRIQLSAMLQDKDNLSLKGLAASQEDVQVYVTALDRSGLFQQVMIQSMQRVSAPQTPFAPTPPMTQTPGIPPTTAPSAATATPAPSLYDAYEIDDFDPKAIAVGQIQWHSFNPIYDIDRVTFLGKAGKRYCILALPQALGVDTVLEVKVGGQTYSNDDCRLNPELISCQCPTGTVTSSLASLVEIQIPLQADQRVDVRVSNRGQYGPDQWYTLLVSESSPDAYEIDDIAPKPIAVGEVQMRTFYPAGDIDRVTFPVKAGYSYELRTLDLALGVDTVLSVNVNGVVYRSDDIAPGDLSSRVVFQATADGVAQAAVTNKGSYGPNASYKLQLLLLGGDAYEPDDLDPHPISPYERQRRTFFPANDVDRVTFNVKAGYIYEVRTYSLTVGVDTVLSILVGGRTYQNDDVAPGDPSSRVIFTAQANGQALATVTNREQFGPDKEYWLTLTELVGTPTPIHTLAPTTPAPTPTPDYRDAYEPDDQVPRFMSVGEVQERNFYPSGDVDRAVFTAKAGYAYVIETTDLATGVDTVLSVQIGGTTLGNDDRSPQDLSSRVQIQNLTGADAPAFVTITNKGAYGADKTYRLRVTDAGSGDPFEVDDYTPVPIALGAPQQRTFYPPGDVDRVSFVAKAGHRYRIATANLAPGVDTIIEVEMGGARLSNDDRLPGDLSSYLELQNHGPNDSQAIVTIMNRGQYGPDKTYEIQVDDLGVESGDEYEPDMTVKRYISVGETQRHTFYPDLDVDRVSLIIKAGRIYDVMTCGSGCGPLMPGVDTLMVVAGPIRNCDPPGCQSDDAYPGTGNLSSRVIFEAISDGEATITIYNKGLFGPAMEYFIRVSEVGALPTATATVPLPAATATPTRTPTLLPYPVATPTHTPTSSPYPLATPTQSSTALAYPSPPTPTPSVSSYSLREAGSRYGLAAPLIDVLHQASPAPPAGGTQVIEFVLSLTLKRSSP